MENNFYALYQRFLDNKCSEEELTLLFRQFLTADEDKLRLLIEEELQKDDTLQSANAYEAERLGTVKQLVNSKIERRVPVRKLFIRISTAAAVIIGAALSILYFTLHQEKPVSQPAIAIRPVLPGHKQATLTLANGKKITLSKTTAGVIATLGNTKVSVSSSGGLSYMGNDPVGSSPVSYNTLTTARGEQSPYPLVLADGSKVWLNAASSITFPTQFTGSERTVTVSGEAYFEVAHNAAKQFKVITENQEVKVLGTHFNIKAYPDDPNISTTLLQGSIKVTDQRSGASGLLVPGQQAKLNKDNRQIAVKIANLEEAIAWKNGFFMFDNQRIESVMKSMSRWYDVEIEYRNFSSNERFGGTFSRSSNLNDILSSLQGLGTVHLKLEKRKIIVSN